MRIRALVAVLVIALLGACSDSSRGAKSPEDAALGFAHAVAAQDFPKACDFVSPVLRNLLGEDCPAELKTALAEAKLDLPALKGAKVTRVDRGAAVEDTPVDNSEPAPGAAAPAKEPPEAGAVVHLSYGDRDVPISVVQRGSRWYVTLA